MNNKRTFNLQTATIFGIAAVALSVAAPSMSHAAPPTLSPAKVLAPIDLRGYGRVSGAYRTAPSLPGASVLTIDCADVPKAKLMLAKYLSDLTCLPGVSPVTIGGSPKLSAHAVAGVGVVAAVRSSVHVYVATGRDATAVTSLIATLPAASEPLVSTAEISVPMYLDRWDKYGFRFYYRPWEQPKDQPADKVYDVNAEFEYAAAQGHSGMVFWDDMNSMDTAEGINNEVWWDWGQKTAKKYNLPVAINDGLFANLNRYRDQEAQRMPQYVGDFYSVARQDVGGLGMVSWNATTAADEALGAAQATIKDFSGDANVVSWLEPHGELNHGPHTVFMEWGPAADAGYRKYLQEQFKTPAAVGERWYGDAKRIKTWEDIRVPEVASFLGWGPDAIDLTGTWRINYESFTGKVPEKWELNNYGNRRVEGSTPAPDAWYAPGFDDTSWAKFAAPGNDATMFLAKRPAVYRRTFDITPAWKSAHPKAYLYVWDLSTAANDTVRTFLNGTELPKSTCIFNTPHWMALDISETLKAGPNSLAIRLPKGYIAYRAYISSQPPVQYPNLGMQANARWVDFARWQQWCRINMVKRGMNMIRQVDPDRQITQMHPDEYADVVKELCEDYGAEFHNTGYMGGFYADLNPLLMNGSDLPVSLEPGGPAKDLLGYKKQMGLWYSEGVQSVDYFIHIGDVLWNQPIKEYFEKTQNQVHMFGKYHTPKAKVAVLYSYSSNVTNTYPWGSDPNTNVSSGYWSWNAASPLRARCDRDGITDRDFARGTAAAYKVVVDSNTATMDEETVKQVEAYVRNGGVFVTFVQTGRHTPLQLDSWPISRLTGYKVTHIDKLAPNGEPVETRSLKAAAGQPVFDDASVAVMNGASANGLTLEPSAPDVHNLLLWNDGSAAAGYRTLGKGMIVQLGCKWHGRGMFDRIEPGGSGNPQVKALSMLFGKLMDWQAIPTLPGHITTDNDDILMRHWVSNNGLYDVWTLWNQNSATARTADLIVDGAKPLAAYDVDSATAVTLQSAANGSAIRGITLDPMQTRIFLTARPTLDTASLDWFTLQRNWWRGTTKPLATPLPAPSHKLTVDLGGGWTWRALADTEDAAALAKSAGGIGKGEAMRLGIWTLPDHRDVKHGVFQKTFTVPATWTTGRVDFWLQSWFSTTFVDKGRIWVDGDLAKDWSRDGIAGDDLGGRFKAGSTHTVTVEVTGAGSLIGSRGTSWLSWKPAPLASVDLAGEWTPSSDMLTYDAPIDLPGAYRAQSLRRTVNVPATFAGKNVIFSAEAPNPMMGVIVNGHWIRRHHHMIGNKWALNVTPYIKLGAENTIELVAPGGSGRGRVNAVALEAYLPANYP
ncbi:MAG TPA: hypothetical protein VGK19_07705 [Capsulimonadaceae bacterium]|jgi:hypothetical protein